MTFGRPQIRLVENTNEKLARILLERYGVRVIFKANCCMTDGRDIYLPAIPANASEEFLGAIPGFLDHEVSHQKNTDFKVFERVGRAGQWKLHEVMQFLEDARHEPLMIKEWRGCAANFRRTEAFAHKRLVKNWDKLSPWGRFTQIMGAISRGGLQSKYTQELAQFEPEMFELASTVEDLLIQAPSALSTEVIRELGSEILKRLQAEVEHQQQEEEESEEGSEGTEEEGQGQAQSGKPESEEESEEEGQAAGGNETGEEEESGEEEGEEGEESESNESEEEESSGGEPYEEEEEEGESEGSTSEEESEDPDPESLEEILSENFEPGEEERNQNEEVASIHKMIEAEVGEELSCQSPTKLENRPYAIYTTERDVIEVVEGGDKQMMLDLINSSRSITNVLRQKMMRNLLSSKASRWDPGQLRGRLDPSSAFRVALGTSKRVFRRQVTSLSLNTRALLMVDHSDSMRGKQLRIAAEAASLFGESLNAIGIPFAIVGYSTSTDVREGHQIYNNASPEDKEIYTRWGGLWIGIYKSFEDSWTAVKHRCANMARNQKCNTYDGEAVRWGALYLMRYPEQRKLMFVFNDGFPCPNVWPAFSKPHENYLKEVLEIVEKNIEVFAIGIKSAAVKRFYSNNAVIQRLDDLSKVMISELDQMLRRNQNVYRSVG